MKDIEKTVIKILANNIAADKRNNIVPESNLFDDLGFDSLTLLKLSLELEQKANFDSMRASEEANLAEVRTVADFFNLIKSFQK